MITKHQMTIRRKKIPEKTEMKSLVSIINDLHKTGYNTQFKATAMGLLSLSTMNMFKSFQVKVVHYYRFEGESDPSDNSIVYAIKTLDGEKGTLVDGYGTASDPMITEFMSKVVSIHK